MGGKALKNTFVERKNIIDYLNIKQAVINILNKYIVCSVVRELPDKTDFGDLDILYLHDDYINIHELVISLFKPNEIVINGNILSFDYCCFQIDLIKCNEDNYESSQFFYSYGDLGTILGMIAKHYKLSFGCNGLYHVSHNPNTNKKEKILITTCPANICYHLGLNYNTWLNGFTKNDNVIGWIFSSKLYKKDIFLTQNITNKNLSRPFFRSFINSVLHTCI